MAEPQNPQDPQKPLPFDQAKAEAAAKAILAQNGTQADVNAYLAKTYGLKPAGSRASQLMESFRNSTMVPADVTSALPRNRSNPSGDLEVLGRGLAANAASALQIAPGSEAVEAKALELGSRATKSPMDYDQSLAALRKETNAIPDVIKYPMRALVAAKVTPRALLPKTIAGAGIMGGGLSAADKLAQADRNVDFKDRLINAAEATPMGAAFGTGLGVLAKGAHFASELLPLLKRVRAAPTLGQQAVGEATAQRFNDLGNYGRAKTEGVAAAGRPANPEVTAALDHPVVKPYASAIRGSQAYKGADEATVLRETYKLMSEDELAIDARRANKEGQYSAADALNKKDITIGKQVLLKAAAAPGTRPPLHLDIAGETTNVEPEIQPARPRLEGPSPRRTTDVQTETGAQAGTREALQRQQGLRDARAAGEVEGLAVEHGLNKPVIREPAEKPVPEFTVAEQQERVTRPGVSITTPAMRVQTAPAEAVPPQQPSLPGAVAEHRESATLSDIGNQAAENAKRVMRGTDFRAKSAISKSPEGIGLEVSKYTPEQARVALLRTLGRAQRDVQFKPSFNVKRAVGTPVQRLVRLKPLVEQIDELTGRPVPTPRPPTGFSRAVPTSAGVARGTDLLRQYIGALNSPFASPEYSAPPAPPITP